MKRKSNKMPKIVVTDSKAFVEHFNSSKPSERILSACALMSKNKKSK